MKKCERAFKIQLRKALTEQKRRQAIAIGKFLMIVVGWGISFKQKDPAAILGAFGEVMNSLFNSYVSALRRSRRVAGRFDGLTHEVFLRYSGRSYRFSAINRFDEINQLRHN